MAIYAELKVQTEFPDDLPCRTCSELSPIVYVDVEELRSWDTFLSRTIICKCRQLETCRAIQRQLKERMNLHEPDNPNG